MDHTFGQRHIHTFGYCIICDDQVDLPSPKITDCPLPDPGPGTEQSEGFFPKTYNSFFIISAYVSRLTTILDSPPEIMIMAGFGTLL